METTTKVRQKMIEARKKKKLTQQKLSEMTGTTRSNIAKIETGVQNPSWELAEKICKALKIKLTDL